jgi:hypothetical protein
MIALSEIVDDDLYSQDDASLLLGEGFTERAAREAIRSACQAGQIESSQWRKRWWFTGRQFKAWVRRWFGAETALGADRPRANDRRCHVFNIAEGARSGENGPTDSEPVRRRRGRR